jgi:hypothetical protein
MTHAANARVTRRQLLVGTAAVVATGAAGTVWLAFRTANASEWIEAVVRSRLPNARLDSASLQRFATQLALDPEFKSKKIELALGLDSLAPALVRIAPEVQRKIERLERVVISSYLLSSNFFRVTDPAAETLFVGGSMPACGNPFARFLNS